MTKKDIQNLKVGEVLTLPDLLIEVMRTSTGFTLLEYAYTCWGDPEYVVEFKVNELDQLVNLINS